MQRLIVVYNPRSSKHRLIEKEVLASATKLHGYIVGKFEVKKVPIDENSANLSKILLDGDLIIAAGGDGTGAVALNGALLSKKSVTLGVLGYGNFNDFARTLGYHQFSDIISDFETKDSCHLKALHPLEAIVDGNHFRFSACYFTIGMFAESTEIFDQKATRTSLKTGKKSTFYSIFTLAKWYFRHKNREFLPPGIQLNDKPLNRIRVAKSGKSSRIIGGRTSDLMFVNGKTVAKMMKGGNWWENPSSFLVCHGKLSSFFRLISFMFKSIFKRLPGEIYSVPVKISFAGKSEIEIQGEGEYKRLAMHELVIKKSTQKITVITK